MNKNNQNRRAFLKSLAKSGVAAGALGSLSQMALVNQALAMAPNFTGGDREYKALVCIYLRGGNDSFNTFIPLDSDGYSNYESARAGNGLAVSNTDLDLMNSFASERLRPGNGNPYHVDGTLEGAYTKGVYDLSSKGIKLGINGLMPELAQLITDNKASIIANVGNLIEPVTRQQIIDETANLPLFLFAHNHQTRLLQTGRSDELINQGWAGRIADEWTGINNDSNFGLNVSYASQAKLMIGDTTSPLVLNSGAPLQFSSMLIDKSIQHDDRRAVFKALSGIMRGSSNGTGLALDTPDFGDEQPFEALFGSVMDRSFTTFDELSGVWRENDVSFSTKGPYGEDLFDNIDAAKLGIEEDDALVGSFFRQLESVAKMIELGSSGAFHTGEYQRQIFFISLGEFDHHTRQIQKHPRTLRELSLGLWKFQKAMQELGHENKVTTFTTSEFGRSLGINGTGTDHGWGSHQLVMGGDGNNNRGNFNGGELFGKLPDLTQGGVDDYDEKGRMIPTLSNEQVQASICEWFGVDESLISSIFPTLSNFETSAGDPKSAYLRKLFV